AHVERARDRAPARGLDARGGRAQAALVAVAHRDVGTEACTRRRDFRTDTGRRTGHDDEAVGQKSGIGPVRHEPVRTQRSQGWRSEGAMVVRGYRPAYDVRLERQT